MLGLALGDALGAPTEFLSLDRQRAAFGDPASWQPLRPLARITDDTQMTLATGRALCSLGELTPAAAAQALQREYLVWYRDPENNRAPGNTCLAACRNLERGLASQDATIISSKGCGANMRVAPVGLLPVSTPGLTDATRRSLAHLVSAVTHGHPTALAATDLTAYAVFLLTEGTSPTDLLDDLRDHAAEASYDEEWLGDLWSRAGDPDPASFLARGYEECARVLERVDASSPTPWEDDPCARTGAGWVAEEALATALQCFLESPDDPLRVLRRGAATSGDSDSIASIAGAFAGAYLGECWPTDWVERLEHRDELASQAACWG